MDWRQRGSGDGNKPIMKAVLSEELANKLSAAQSQTWSCC